MKTLAEVKEKGITSGELASMVLMDANERRRTKDRKMIRKLKERIKLKTAKVIFDDLEEFLQGKYSSDKISFFRIFTVDEFEELKKKWCEK